MTKQHSNWLRTVGRCFWPQTFFWLIVVGTTAGCADKTPTGESSATPSDAAAVDAPPADPAAPAATETPEPPTGDPPAEMMFDEAGLANQEQLTVLLPGSPAFSGVQPVAVGEGANEGFGDPADGLGEPTDGLGSATGGSPLEGNGPGPAGFPRNPPASASGIELPWVPGVILSEREREIGTYLGTVMILGKLPLAQQPHRHAVGVVTSMDAVVPEPITEMESFSAALEVIRPRFLAAHHLSPDRRFDQITSGAENIPDLVERLQSQRTQWRSDLIQLLGLFGEHASEAAPVLAGLIRQHFANPESDGLGFDGEPQCAQALANIGRAAAGEMRLLLQEGRPSEQRFAIAVVGLLGERGSACVPELIAMLDSQDPDVVDAAAWGLAAVGPAAADAVPKFVARLEQDTESRPKAAGVLCSIGPAAVNETLKLSSASDANVRAFAATILGTTGADDPEAVAALGRLLDDADPQVQHAAIVAVAELGPSAKPLVTMLANQLQGPHMLTAIQTLGRLGATAAEAVPDLIQVGSTTTEIPSADNRNRGVSWGTVNASIERRVAALDAVAQIGQADATSVTTLTGLLQDPKIGGEPKPNWAKISGQAAKTLGALGSAARPAVPQLIEVIKNPMTIQRGRNQEEPKGYEFVYRMVGKWSGGTQSGATVKLVALESLGRIGDSSPAVLEVCRHCLKDEDPAIRVVAVKSLVDLGQTSPELAEICKDAVEQVTADSLGIGLLQNSLALHLAAPAFKALGDNAVPVLIDIVNSPDPAKEGVEFAMLILGEIGQGSIDARLSLLRICLVESGIYLDDEIKEQTLDMLAQDSKAHVATLTQLLSDEAYAQAAAERLAEVGADAASAVPKLLELLKSEDVNARANAVKALSNIGDSDERVIPAIVEALEDDEYQVHQEAFKGLCENGLAASLHAGVIVEYAATKGGGFETLDLLGRLGADVILPPILEHLGDDQAYRSLAHGVLTFGRMTVKGEANARLLSERLSDPKVEVRQFAMMVLQEMGEEARPVLKDIKKATRDEDRSVSWTASRSLLDLLPLDEAVAAAPPRGRLDPLKGKTDQIVRRMLAGGKPTQETLKMMSDLRKQGSVGYWVRSLKSPDPKVRLIAAWILQPGSGTAESVLKTVVDDPKTTPELKTLAEQMLQGLTVR